MLIVTSVFKFFLKHSPCDSERTYIECFMHGLTQDQKIIEASTLVHLLLVAALGQHVIKMNPSIQYTS